MGFRGLWKTIIQLIHVRHCIDNYRKLRVNKKCRTNKSKTTVNIGEGFDRDYKDYIGSNVWKMYKNIEDALSGAAARTGKER